ncbi:hypothetical protein BDV59DRAFT_127447 [Aspergillus ambiguus]|uniref:uncharacterized protein n=1 Tax=Aspergillus ambiguus TaxID=176160 RepID=UPI003CCDCA83
MGERRKKRVGRKEGASEGKSAAAAAAAVAERRCRPLLLWAASVHWLVRFPALLQPDSICVQSLAGMTFWRGGLSPSLLMSSTASLQVNRP